MWRPTIYYLSITYYTAKYPKCQIMLHACKTCICLQRRMLQMRLASQMELHYTYL